MHDASKSVRTKLRESILMNLRKIDQTHGYLTTIGEVFDIPKGAGEIKRYPAIQVKFGPHECQNMNDGSNTQGFELHYKVLVNLTVYFKSNTDINLARENIVADLQKLFARPNEQIRDENGEPTCFECMWGTDAPYGMEETNPFHGHNLELWVWYRQDGADPTRFC